jgi:hypothetical protein
METKILRYDTTTTDSGKSRFIIVAVTGKTEFPGAFQRVEHSFTAEQNAAVDADPAALAQIVNELAANAYYQIKQAAEVATPQPVTASKAELVAISGRVTKADVLEKVSEIEGVREGKVFGVKGVREGKVFGVE